jgi:hypothetical protein
VPLPPVAVIGVTGVIASNNFNVTDDVLITGINATAPTVRLKLLLLDWLAWSCAVTVYNVVAFSAVGVPLIAPVVVLKLSPAGSAGDIDNDIKPNPPLAVTGINEALCKTVNA